MNFIEKGAKNIWLPYTQMQNKPTQIEVESTKDCEIILKNGKRLIDGISSWWSVSHGYNHPKITKAIEQQLKKMPHIMMAGIANEQTYKLAYNLAKITPKNLNKVFFSDSGSTAIEVAMKMAAQYFINQKKPDKIKFISFQDSYHGDTAGAMSLADLDSGMHKKFKNYLPKNYNLKLPKNREDFLEFENFIKNNGNKIAGIVIEPLVQCAGGMKFHKADILQKIYQITKKYQLLFIADECAVGFYRTGKFFACNHANISPDIMVLGKALTGGFMTLAATVTTDEIFNQFLSNELDTALMHGPTFMGNPLAASAANASIELFLEENYEKKVQNIEKILKSSLNKLKKYQKVVDVRILGAIGVIEIETNWEEITFLRQYFTDHNIWLRPFSNVIYVMPPLTIAENQILKIASVIEKFLKSR